MRRSSMVALMAFAAAAGLVAAPAGAQRYGAAGSPSHVDPAPQPPPAPPDPPHATGAPVPHGGVHATRPPMTPTVPPFPNIATLSGPLPQGLNPPFVSQPRELFRSNFRPHRPSLFYPGYAYGGAYADTAPQASRVSPVERQPAAGMLRLDVTPASAQVFVDGAYAGTVEDVERRRGLSLAEGPHRLELRARGYATESIDVLVPAYDVVTYRGTLDPQRPPAPAARGPATIYVIPGCYMGNVPPRPERVGPGCDVSRVRVVASTAPGHPATQ